jgi:hypothetical protein
VGIYLSRFERPLASGSIEDITYLRFAFCGELGPLHSERALVIVVLGYGAFALNQCEVTNCEFTFAGPAASVVQTMATIYHSLGEQGRNLIEGTFEQIRNAGGNKPA